MHRKCSPRSSRPSSHVRNTSLHRAEHQVCETWARSLETHHGLSRLIGSAERSDYAESTAFPALEQHLGTGFLAKNVEQHAAFHPALTEFVGLLADVRSTAAPFDGAEIARRVQAFGPGLVQHLSDEIETLHVNTLKENVPLAEALRIHRMQEEHIKASVGLVRIPRRRRLICSDHRHAARAVQSQSRAVRALVRSLSVVGRTDSPGRRSRRRFSGSSATSRGIAIGPPGTSALATRTASSKIAS